MEDLQNRKEFKYVLAEVVNMALTKIKEEPQKEKSLEEIVAHQGTERRKNVRETNIPATQ